LSRGGSSRIISNRNTTENNVEGGDKRESHPSLLSKLSIQQDESQMGSCSDIDIRNIRPPAVNKRFLRGQTLKEADLDAK
jgi:hypothetical protein